MQLVWPSREYLPSYVAALERGWSPDNLREEAARREQLGQIGRDAQAFLAGLVDMEGTGGPVTLPDGAKVPRLPGYYRWMWDGEFSGTIGLRWQPGTEALPPYCLGHVGYAVVPWKRRLGYATRALAEVLRDARARGLRYVELTTLPDNVASRRVIENNGGVLVEEFAAPLSVGGKRELRYRVHFDDGGQAPRGERQVGGQLTNGCVAANGAASLSGRGSALQENTMRGALLFIAGMSVGIGVQAGAGQTRDIVSLNHVAISVEKVEQADKFYTDVMRFPQAFTFHEPDGQLALSYYQINRNTFIELQPATPTRPAGFVHFGLEVTDVGAVVERLRAHGVEVGDPAVSPRTKTRIAVARTPQGTSFELLEFVPDSLHRKVIEAWR